MLTLGENTHMYTHRHTHIMHTHTSICLSIWIMGNFYFPQSAPLQPVHKCIDFIIINKKIKLQEIEWFCEPRDRKYGKLDRKSPFFSASFMKVTLESETRDEKIQATMVIPGLMEGRSQVLHHLVYLGCRNEKQNLQ